MSANTDLPRGVVLSSSPGLGNAASVNFPACPGLAWVVTDIYLGAFNASNATDYATGIAVTPIGFLNLNNIGEIVVLHNAGGNAFSDWTYKGKPVIAAVNQAINISFGSGAISFVEQICIASGYVI